MIKRILLLFILLTVYSCGIKRNISVKRVYKLEISKESTNFIQVDSLCVTP